MVSSTTPGKRFTHFVKISLLVRYHITTSPSQKRYEKRYERPELLRTFLGPLRFGRCYQFIVHVERIDALIMKL